MNEERILFRQGKRQEKLRARQLELERVQKEKRNLEKRLEALRKTVAIEVEAYNL